MPPPGAALSLEALATKLATEGPHKTLPTPRLIQVLFNNTFIVRTTAAVYVWEHPYYPQLYVPDSAVTPQHLKLDSEIKTPTGNLIAQRFKLTAGDRETTECLSFSSKLEGKAAALRNMVRLTFGAMDQWFEEASPIYIHPKDPFKRIDILTSTRRVRISIQGTVVAETSSSLHLYETGLPCRYYFPRTDVRQEVLRRSETRTQCPYKGEAEYFHVQLGEGKAVEDVVWYYDRPSLECGKIEGLVCFYNEKVDVEIDGMRQQQPVSPWSK